VLLPVPFSCSRLPSLCDTTTSSEVRWYLHLGPSPNTARDRQVFGVADSLEDSNAQVHAPPVAASGLPVFCWIHKFSPELEFSLFSGPDVEQQKQCQRTKQRRPSHRTQWAAQFAVASELCKRGYEVAFTMGNHPMKDLMVISPTNVSFVVDVKGLYKRNVLAGARATGSAESFLCARLCARC
jgi:hypothetical protein